MKQMRNAMFCLGLILLFGQASPKQPLQYRSFAADFERVADSTSGLPMAERVKVFRSTFDKLCPGLYADADQSRLDGRIERALTGFPSIRSTYDEIERKFPEALASAMKEFRGTFPDFTPPMPIYLIHSLETRDGGTDWVAPVSIGFLPDWVGDVQDELMIASNTWLLARGSLGSSCANCRSLEPTTRR